jgi:predicted Zn-dependent peptidase
MKLAPLLLLTGGLLAGQSADLDIPFEKYKLKNGLRVILSRDPSVPVVSVYMIYGVGARSEEKGRTGFAHLFEHMMFQGSANAPKGLHFKLVESNGGNLNGSTHPDFTDYFEVLPSNKLAVGLWLESDRMRSLAITKENLDNQKEAVKQERRLSFDNRPYATAIVDKWPELAFQNWQNQHSIIGSFEDLNAASVEDVSKFFKTYYAPNNAVLSVVGDINIADAKKWIENYFADIPSQTQPKHPDLTEPAPKARHEVYTDKLAKVPAVIMGYPGPVRRSADYYALAMADVLLTGGESSRFQQNLVKGKQSVINFEANLGWPFASPSDYKDPGLYAMYFLHNPRYKGEQIVGQVEEELNRLKNEPVAMKELERARTFLRAARIGELQTSLARARLLAQYELLDGKPELLSTELNQMLAVTPEQIQAAAKKYLQKEKLVSMEIVPAAAPAAKKEGE